MALTNEQKARIKSWYRAWAKRTGRGGSILIGKSSQELLEAIFDDKKFLEAFGLIKEITLSEEAELWANVEDHLLERNIQNAADLVDFWKERFKINLRK